MAPTSNLIRHRNSLADNIAEDLRKSIRSGSLPVGSRLVGRRELAARYGVAPMTIQQAINQLIADGAIRAENGRGTYVQSIPNVSVAQGNPVVVAPQRIARRSQRRAPMTIGVISNPWAQDEDTVELSDNWPAAILRAFEWQMSSEDGVILRSVIADHSESVNALASLVDEGMAGCVVIVGSMSENDDVSSLISSVNVPLVIAGGIHSLRIPSVFYDSEHAGFQAGRHLLQRGYRKIAFYCPFREVDWIEQRRSGLKAALADEGVTLTEIDCTAPKTVPSSSTQPEDSYQYAKRYLRDSIVGLGIVAANDHAAHGLLKAASELGLRAGTDFGIIGFDDRSRSRRVDMTSLHPPLDAIGAEAAKLLMHLIDGNCATTQIRLQSYLIPRGSTRPVNQVAELSTAI